MTNTEKYQYYMDMADKCIAKALTEFLNDDKMSVFYYNASEGFRAKARRLLSED